MALAQAISVKLKYVAEVTTGVTPTSGSSLTLSRYTTSSFNLTIGTTTSTEIVVTGDTSDLVRTSGSTGGDISFEYSFVEYRPFMESALRSTFSTAVAVTSTGISMTVASTTYTLAGFSTTNILAGHWIKIAGFSQAANNGIAKVSSVAATSLVLNPSFSTCVTEAAGQTVSVSGRSIRNGTTKKTFTIEQEFNDVTQFSNFKGQQVDTMELHAASGAIITGKFGFKGMTGAYTTTSLTVSGGMAAEIAATTNPLMSAVANIGTIYIDGIALSGVYFKNINLTTNNQSRQLDAINNLYPIGINLGTISVKFAVTSFFSDTTLLARFVNGTSFSLVYSFYDSTGKYCIVDAPNCKFDTGTLDGITLNSDVMQNLSITALRNPAAPTYTIQISEIG